MFSRRGFLFGGTALPMQIGLSRLDPRALSNLIFPDETNRCIAVLIGLDFEQTCNFASIQPEFAIQRLSQALSSIDLDRVSNHCVEITSNTLVRQDNQSYAAALEAVLNQVSDELISRNTNAVIYYLGHGAVINGEFHGIMPDLSTVPLADILSPFDESRATLGIVDACRVSLAAYGINSADCGLSDDQFGIDSVDVAEIDFAYLNTAILYSTMNGREAYADPDIVGLDQTLFTQALIENVATPLSLDQLRMVISANMRTLSLQSGFPSVQEPSLLSNLDRPIFLAGAPSRVGPAFQKRPHHPG